VADQAQWTLEPLPCAGPLLLRAAHCEGLLAAGCSGVAGRPSGAAVATVRQLHAPPAGCLPAAAGPLLLAVLPMRVGSPHLAIACVQGGTLCDTPP
jgi:hypothetical protein